MFNAATRTRGAGDARLREHLIVGGVAVDVRMAGAQEALEVAVDDDHALPGAGDVPGDRPPHPAPATDDDVVLQPVDVMVHASPPEQPAEVALDQRLDQHPERVEGGTDAAEDQRHREDLAAVGQGLEPHESRLW